MTEKPLTTTDYGDVARPDVPQAKRVLVLHVEVPGVWVDDLDEVAAEYFDGDYLEAVTSDDAIGLDEQVGLTVVVHGDENGPMVHAYTCRVVGAETREARRG